MEQGVPARPDPQPRFDRQSAARYYRVLFTMLVTASLLAAVGFSFILCLALHPFLPKFSISSASVSPFNLSSTHLTAKWDIVFSVRNPNILAAGYGSVNASIIYGSTILANTFLFPFSEGKPKETSVTATLSNYVNEDTAGGLAADRAGGSIEFQVRLSSLFLTGTSFCCRVSRHMEVWCGHVPIGFSNQGAGSLSGAPRGCDVRW
ncbi:hypothetical protein AAC387_Pa04g1705 [Persea americana]